MRRILIVEDDSTTRALLKATLRLGGYEATEAPDGSDAIELLSATHFDLVLLDIMMPQRSGYEVLDWMQGRDDLRDVPVVVISSTEHASGLIREALGGAIDHVTKPFGHDQVIGVVEQALSMTPEQLAAQRERLAAAAQAYAEELGLGTEEVSDDAPVRGGILGRFRRGRR